MRLFIGLAAMCVATAAWADRPTWRLFDSTDNISGVRTVNALAMSETEIAGTFPGLWIQCQEGQVVLALSWTQALPTEFVLVQPVKGTPDDFFDLGRPVPWDVDPFGGGKRAVASAEESNRIMGALGHDATNLMLRIHTSGQPKEALWLLDGAKTSYDHVKEHCGPQTAR